MEEIEIRNPFGYGKAGKVIDENKKPAEWWADYLAYKDPVAENEFYILFQDTLLVKKGRSKFRTSQYLAGDRYKSFALFYEKF